MKTQLWMPVLGELHWALHAADEPSAQKQGPTITTLAEYNAARQRADLDTLTESFVELYLEANPNMAQRLGHA